MNRRNFLKNTGLVTAGLALAPLGRALNIFDFGFDLQGRRVARGVVYHDKSGSGIRPPGAKGISGVYVSNGREVAKTNSLGQYEIPIDEGSVLFVIKPSNWRVAVNENHLPQSYYVYSPKGSPTLRYKGVDPTGEMPESIDFGLQPQKEDPKFKMILFGDPQPRNQNEIDYIAHDVVEQVVKEVKTGNAKFGLSLGDEMFDNLSLYDSLNGVVGTCGIPWYNTVGNHDLNYDSPDNAGATETWKRVYGPPHYAFNYANVHFLVLNDVVWHGRVSPGYHGEITADQLEFVRNDLATVPKDKLVVIAMHIPLIELRNKTELMALFADRKYTFSLSAHTHIQAHHFLGELDGWKGESEHHHLNHATVCGSWWQGALDERGIPNAIMADGAPNGYSVIEFDRNKYKVTFRAASRPEWDQMNIWLPEAIPQDQVAGTEVTVNVFAGSDRSIVEMSLDGITWTPMVQSEGQDPYFLKLKELEASPKPPDGLKLPGAARTRHLWKSTLPSGLRRGIHSLHVRTKDVFGQTYTEQRVLRVTP